MALYFASQGAGRLLWPLVANLTRLAIAGGGGWLALRWTGNVTYVFVAQGLALAVFGLIIASAVGAGAWFATPGRSRRQHGGQQKRAGFGIAALTREASHEHP